MKQVEYPVIEGFLQTRVIGKISFVDKIKIVDENLVLLPTLKKKKNGTYEILSFSIARRHKWT